MKDRRAVIKSEPDMDTQVWSPAGLAPPYRQVCLHSRHNGHRTPFPFLPSATKILPRPRPLDFPAKLLLASPLNPPADRLLPGLFTNLSATDRSLAHERNLTIPLPLFYSRSASLALLYRRGPEFMADGGQCCLCVVCVILQATCLGGGYSSGMRLP